MTQDTGGITYLLLADRAVPYLLARVRWPDVAQAITARSPEWLDDPGLFDLPYEPSAVTVTFPQAASVAAGWGRQLHPGSADGVPSFIRRMPANWSDLPPVERRAWGIEPAGTRRPSARRVRRLRLRQAKAMSSLPPAQGNGHRTVLGSVGEGPRGHGPVANGHGQSAGVTTGFGGAATDRRRHSRVRVDGRAHIRIGHTTISAGLVDLSEGGVRCVLPEPPAVLVPDGRIHGPFLLEAEKTSSRICLDAAGRVRWQRSAGDGTHFGAVFGELGDGQTEGLQWFLTTAASRRGPR